MSLLIKGMDMPTSCFDCRFCYLFSEYCDDEVYWISTKVYKCKAIEKSHVFKRKDDLINGKLPNCPLTEIPTPHGRLIDAEKLLRALAALKYMATVEGDRLAFSEVLEEIAKAPTVIEAEE